MLSQLILTGKFFAVAFLFFLSKMAILIISTKISNLRNFCFSDRHCVLEFNLYNYTIAREATRFEATDIIEQSIIKSQVKREK